MPVIERAGGAVALNARVERLLVEGGRVAGARLADGSEHRAAAVISAAGARSTVESLLPAELRDAPWVRDILSLELTPCHVGLYLGLAGDIRAAGATTANHWIYGTWDTGAATWRDPERTEPPLMFVSFPSLKDAAHDPGPQQRHTAEAVVWVDWEAFAPWQDSSLGHRPEAYARYKPMLGDRLLAHFKRCFPRIAPLVRYSEVSTPSPWRTTSARHAARCTVLRRRRRVCCRAAWASGRRSRAFTPPGRTPRARASRAR